MNAYEKVTQARAKGRATAIDYIQHVFADFMEFHGDRRFGDDPAILAGIARLGELPVTVIGIERGRNTNEKIARNFGSAHPEGYRKSVAPNEASREISTSSDMFSGYFWRLLWYWCRGKRTSASYCRKLDGDDDLKSADHFYYNWGRRQWWCFRFSSSR